MGTGKGSRYLNTHGSGRRSSDYALVHSNEGTFSRPSKPTDVLRLASGEHGQKGMDLLDKYGIKYDVIKTYPNGVRVGNIPNHKKILKRKGLNQTWFLKTWTENDIRRAAEHVAGLPENRHISDGTTIYGTYKGDRVGVKRTHGQIGTVFPDAKQPVTGRRRRRR